MDNATAVIEVDDIGVEIKEKERKKIFDFGKRGSEVARIKRYPGSGYGLWETRTIIEAHGGEIYVRFTPTHIQRHEGRATRVVFSLEIPLSQRIRS